MKRPADEIIKDLESLSEQRYPWLVILLDSYAVCDEGTAKDLAREKNKQGCSVACHKGCSACCLNPVVPISELELRGISWYVSEQLDQNTQDQLIPRLENHKDTSECPFLLNHICSIYPMRPIACRIFHMFRKACTPYEKVIRTRPQDVFTQNRDTARRVALRFLDADVYGLKTELEKEEAFDQGIMMKMSTQMHEVDWTRFVWAINLIRKAKRK
jgi:Fe-S-cluster containining protein